MPDVSGNPTAFEQEMLEWINRLRLDPQAGTDALIALADEAGYTNAINYFGVDLAAFSAAMDLYDPVAPLAWNNALGLAAELHSQQMIDFDEQSHQLPGEPGLGERVTDAGYVGWRSLRENVFAYTDSPLQGHAGFVIDWGFDDEDFGTNGSLLPDWQTRGDGMQDPAGHRIAIMDAGMDEVGIGVLTAPGGLSIGPYVVTQNFGSRFDYAPQLLGVIMDDTDDDGFYDAGEGLGGVTITATGAAGVFTTTSWGAGGYQMELPSGVYNVTFSGSSLPGTVQYSVTIQDDNVKLDVLADDVQPVRLVGTEGADELIGAPGQDRVLIGFGGPDTLIGADGDDILLGDTLSPIAVQDIADQVYRLYQAALDRAPDPQGYNNWIERLFEGERTLLEVAAGFVNSAEFATTYGALGNEEFVTLLYDNVLGRAPDPAGLANWTSQLEGGASRAEVVIGFSESQEFRNNTAQPAQSFAEGRSPAAWSDDVYRLYQAMLDREPDPGGFANWTEYLGSGHSYLSVVEGFENSTEFQSRYGALNNEDFVTLLYANVLDRQPDPTGFANWTGALDSGALTRAEVVAGFAQSSEFRQNTADALEAWMRGQGTDDRLDGGGGMDLMSGGAGADVFVFRAGEGSDSRVLDFEAWDTIALGGTAYADAEAARADFLQSGDDLVLETAGLRVTLENTLLEDLGPEAIILI